VTHNPYYVAKRKPLSTKQRAEQFIAHKGQCCLCGGRILPKEAWIDEHILALWLAQEGDERDLNAPENRGIAHKKCAVSKTAREATDRARGRRAAARHFGTKAPSRRPMPGGRDSKWKKTMDGRWVRRDATDMSEEP